MSLAECERRKFNELNTNFRTILSPLQSDPKIESVIGHLIASYQYKNLLLRLQLQRSQIGERLSSIGKVLVELVAALRGRVISISIEGVERYVAERNRLLQAKIEQATEKVRLQHEILKLEKEKEALIQLIMRLKSLDENIRGRIEITRRDTADLILEFERNAANLQTYVMDVLYQNYTAMTNFQQTQTQVHEERIKDMTDAARVDRDKKTKDCNDLRAKIEQIQAKVTQVTHNYNLVQRNVDIPFPVASILSEPLLSTNRVPVGPSLVFVERDELLIKNFSGGSFSLTDHFLLSFFREADGMVRVERRDLSGLDVDGDTLRIRNGQDKFGWSLQNYWIELYKKRHNGTSVAVTRVHNITIRSSLSTGPLTPAPRTPGPLTPVPRTPDNLYRFDIDEFSPRT